MKIQCLLKARGLSLYSMSLMAVYLENICKLLDTSEYYILSACLVYKDSPCLSWIMCSSEYNQLFGFQYLYQHLYCKCIATMINLARDTKGQV